MAYVKREIGEKITTRIVVKVCKACGCQISDTGLCNFECGFDGNPHSPAQAITRVYERTDVLVEEREG